MRITAGFFTVLYVVLIAVLLVFGGLSDPLMKGIAFQLLVSTAAVWWLQARWSARLVPGIRSILLVVVGVLSGVPAVVVLGKLLY